MSRSMADIAAELDALTLADFDAALKQADGWERRANLCDELEQHHTDDVAGISGLLLGFVERLDGADIGSPGPVVHLLELLPGYEAYLRGSLERRPAKLTLWMANRILNTATGNRSDWLDLLRNAADDEGLRRETRDEARNFIAFQETRSQ